MYYYPSTPLTGSGDPLRLSIPARSLLGTGWGPRGDSGSERGRVRATQPAKFRFLLPPLQFKQSTWLRRAWTKALLFFCVL